MIGKIIIKSIEAAPLAVGDRVAAAQQLAWRGLITQLHNDIATVRWDNSGFVSHVHIDWLVAESEADAVASKEATP